MTEANDDRTFRLELRPAEDDKYPSSGWLKRERWIVVYTAPPEYAGDEYEACACEVYLWKELQKAQARRMEIQGVK